MKTIRLILILILIFPVFGQEGETVKNPEMKFSSPENNEVWVGKKKISIKITGIEQKNIQSVELFLDGKFLKEYNNPPFTLTYDFGNSPKNRVLKAILRDHEGVLLRKEISSYKFDDVQNVNVIEMGIPIAVIDRNGDYVKGLTKDNFELFEDGKQIEVSYLNLISQRKSDFRLILLVDISSSMKDKMGYIKDAAKMFLEDLMRKKDKAIVMGSERLSEINLTAAS